MSSDPAASQEIRRFEEQYSENPDSFVFARLADAYRKAGDRERALAVLRDGLTRHPTYLSARIVHARVLRELGRADEAAEAYGRVLELDGQNMVAVRGLAELARERDDEEAARRWLSRLGAIESLDREVRTMLEDLDEGDRHGGQARAGVGRGGEDGVDGARADGTGEDGRGEAGMGEGASERLAAREGRPEEGGVATATLAGLYLAQGLSEEALGIYLRLLERRPGDRRLAAKVREAWERAGRDPGDLPSAAAERPSAGPPEEPATGSAAAAPDAPPNGEEAADSEGSAGPPPDGAPGAPRNGGKGTDPEAAASPAPGPAAGPGTARELLVALLEGRATVPREGPGDDAASRFRDWLAGPAGR